MNLVEVEVARQTPIEIKVSRFPIEAPHWVLSYIEPQLRGLLGCPSLLEMNRHGFSVREKNRASTSAASTIAAPAAASTKPGRVLA